MSRRLRDVGLLILVCTASTVVMWGWVGMKAISENFDGPYYAVVAKTWYVPELIRTQFAFPLPLEYYAAHFPLYPLLMAGVGLLGMNLLVSGVIATWITSLVGVVAIYLIWEKMAWKYPLWAGLAWLFVWPRMWAVRSVASPEPLFILLVVVSLFAFTQKKYGWAGICGAAAVLTKSPGVLLAVAYAAWAIEQMVKTKKIPWRIWPVGLIPLALVGLWGLFAQQTGDFLAYFHSGDNIHLMWPPGGVFNADQVWVGTFWLEEIVWVYLVALVGILMAWKKNRVWGWFGVVFLLAVVFVSHRDISRYSLPLVPVVLVGIQEIWAIKPVRWALVLGLLPMVWFTANFLSHNLVNVPDLTPFFLFSK